MNTDVPDTSGVRATGSLMLSSVFLIVGLALTILVVMLAYAALRADVTIELSPSGDLQLDPLGPIWGASAYAVLAALGLCDGVVLGLVLWVRPALLIPDISCPRIPRWRRFIGPALVYWRRFIGPTLVCCGVWIIVVAAINMAGQLGEFPDGVFRGIGGRVARTLVGVSLGVVMSVTGSVFGATLQSTMAGDS